MNKYTIFHLALCTVCVRVFFIVQFYWVHTENVVTISLMINARHHRLCKYWFTCQRKARCLFEHPHVRVHFVSTLFGCQIHFMILPFTFRHWNVSIYIAGICLCDHPSWRKSDATQLIFSRFLIHTRAKKSPAWMNCCLVSQVSLPL